MYVLKYRVEDNNGGVAERTRLVSVRNSEIHEGNQAGIKVDGYSRVPVGTAFDAMAGVTATDAQDGDLTAEIQVFGTVDVNVPDMYELLFGDG